jgi:hypothetical protein
MTETTKTETKTETKSQAATGVSQADSELLKSMGIPVCSKCGSGKRTNSEGNLFCPLGDTSCPLLK